MIICERCGRENEDRYKFCLGCGAPLDAMPAVAPAKTSTAGPLPAISSPNAAPAREATPVQPAPTPRVAVATSPSVRPVASPAAAASTQPTMKSCGTCGAQSPINFKFCGQCGARFDVSPQAISKDTLQDLGEPSFMQTRPPTAQAGTLILMHPGGQRGEALSLSAGDNVLGRQQGTMVAMREDPHLSPQHVQIRLEQGRAVIEDLRSLNGVFKQLDRDPVVLAHGDVIRIGQQVLRFEDATQRVATRTNAADGTLPLGGPNVPAWGFLSRLVGPNNMISQVYALRDQEVFIGRERGQILFRRDGFASGQHARLSINDHGQAILHDLGSSNGTYIRLKRPHTASSGEAFLIGQHIYRFELSA